MSDKKSQKNVEVENKYDYNLTNITHPMYERFIVYYTPEFIVNDSVKSNLIERFENIELTKQDKENIFLIIMSHFYKNPIKDNFIDNNVNLPYGGKQLKTKKATTFDLEKLPDQVIFVLHKFIDLLVDIKQDSYENYKPADQFDNEDEENVDYANTNLDYAVLSSQ